MITIGSTTIKSPQTFGVTIKDIKVIDQNAAGSAVIDMVATKRVLRLEWGALKSSEISTILGAMTGATFSVTYPDPQTGASKTVTCYVNDRGSTMARYFAGGSVWATLYLELVEQ